MDKEEPLKDHESDYLPDIWKEYTGEELMWWVINLTRRSTHRDNREKAIKDIRDARNYLWMLEQIIKKEDEE